jgi:NAD(P)-dependent dehydrogenase (short-subunit alcohol dehydrogenase family)
MTVKPAGSLTMKHVLEEYITVKRTIADCFAYLRDFSTIEQWDPSVLSACKLSPGPVQVGSEYQLKLKLFGSRQLDMHYTQVAIDEHELLVLHGHGSNVSALDTLQFKSLDAETTEIHYRAALDINGLAPPVFWLLKPVFNRIGDHAARGLKLALEIPERPKPSLKDAIGDRLLVPAVINFGRRGYSRQNRKSHASRVDGKIIAITGPTAGLGLSAACELARLGATLLLIGRDHRRLALAVNQIADFSGCADDKLHCYQVDLSSLENTAKVAAEIIIDYPEIDVLINNAGALFNEREITAEGFERSLAVNFLSPMLLTKALRPSFHPQSRVINVVSGGLYTQSIRLDDMQYRQPPFNGSKAYARAKRALLTASQHSAKDFCIHNMHPGWAATPGVAKSLPAFNKALRKQLRDSRMGADTMVWLASATELEDFKDTQLWFDRRIHTANVVPGTASSEHDTEALCQWCDDTLAKYL